VPDAPGTQHPLITRRFEGDPSDSLLLTDLYQLNMLQAYNDGTMAGDVLTLEDDPALTSSELEA
jgi:hypothetical protein